MTESERYGGKCIKMGHIFLHTNEKRCIGEDFGRMCRYRKYGREERDERGMVIAYRICREDEVLVKPINL